MQDSKFDEEEDAADGGDPSLIELPGSDWEGQVYDAWLCQALGELPRAVARLSEVEQALVIGHYFDERPLDELASALRIHPERACSVLQQALRELRRIVPH